MKKVVVICLIGFVGLVAIMVIWFNTQPVWPVERVVQHETLRILPAKNKAVVDFIEAKGQELAPTYESAVCTEFVIKVIDHISPLTKGEKNDIRIITNSRLDSLIEVDSPIIKGVQTALLKDNKGTAIYESREVLPGDFVQFWNVFQGNAYGHCGIVLDIEPDKKFTLYSSHPFTGGFGTQEYPWPDKVYFVRLK